MKYETVNDTVNDTVTPAEKGILDLIKTNAGITYDELSVSLNKGRSTIYRTIKRLMSKGILSREGSDKSGRWVIVKMEDVV